MGYMNWIKKIFQIKDISNKDTSNKESIISSIDEKGNISAEISIKINNQNFTIPINTSIELIKKIELNLADPNSCEREPNQDEIKLSIDYPIHKLHGNHDDIDLVFNVSEIAILKGYHYFVISKKIFEELEQETKEMDNYNQKLSLTASLNNEGIALEKDGKIDEAIAIYEENIQLGYPATHAYERLMILYHKRKEFEKEKNVIEDAINIFSKRNNEIAENAITNNINCREKIHDGLRQNKLVLNENGMICFNPYDILKYKKRLKSLNGEKENKKLILPENTTLYEIKGLALGEKFENIKLKFKEFDFYNSGEDRSMSFLNDSNRYEIWRINNEFKLLIIDAGNFESSGDLVSASKIYERIIAEKYYLPTPYDKLIKIYSKANLKDQEIRVIKYSINYFSILKGKQLNYVLTLAQKYDKLSFAKELIATNKKIFYFGGAFELYNPYTIIEKWEQRLLKIVG